MAPPTAREQLAAGRPWRIRTGMRIRNTVLLGMALAVPVCIGLGTATEVGPAWAVHSGHGTLGTWTATDEECGRSCSWTGTFTTPSGKLTLTDTDIVGGAHVEAAGERIPATASGGFVFVRGGSHEWLVDSVAVALCTAATLAWLVVVPTRVIRRRRRTPLDEVLMPG